MRFLNTKLLLIFFLILFHFNFSYAAKNNVISELYVFSEDKNKLSKKIKKITKISKKLPKPRKLRSVIDYEFNEEFINKYIKPNSLKQFDDNLFGETETFDINNNGIIDTLIFFTNPITAYLDLNENEINEIKYVFNGPERYIYYDANEDNDYDYLFIDYNGDGIDEEIIKKED